MYSVDEWIRYGDELRRPFHILPSLSSSKQIAIVGGGISGLTIAYRIGKKRPDISITLIEKKSTLGGVISTWKEEEWICDVAVNATRPHPAVWRLVEDIGLEEKFTPSSPRAKRRWIYRNGKSHRLSLLNVFKMGLFNLRRSVIQSRKGGFSVAELIPDNQLADAMTLGIVNDVSANVDADFLFPSLTKFGANPPIKWSKIKRKMRQEYPIFIPEKGSVASFEGGLSTLVDQLIQCIHELPNVKISVDTDVSSPAEAAELCGIHKASVIWAAPMDTIRESTDLSVFAIGYKDEDVASVKRGYGTLIPDSNIPISGILHETDVHSTKRAPPGHRLFRIMVPHSRWSGDHVQVKKWAQRLLSDAEPTIFQCIGERKIPTYRPGYLSEISNDEYAFNRVGWSFAGVSITHVITEAERVADLF